MPLTKLFQKRHSSNEVSIAEIANKEIEKLKSSFETSTTIGDNQQGCVSNDGTKLADSKQRTSSEMGDFNSKYEYIEKEEYDSKINCKTVSRRSSAPPAMLQKLLRSASCKENQQNPITSATRRKKCVSESDAYDTQFEESKTTQGLVQVKEDPLENMIGRYLNQLIKDSIITAVKNVDVESICEEIMENVSEFGSLLKLEPKEYCEIKEDEIACNADKCVERASENVQNCVQEIREKNFGDNVIESTEQETGSLDGYAADLEESMSLHSSDLELKVKNIQNISVVAANFETMDKSLLQEEHEKECNNLEAVNLQADIDSIVCEKQKSSCFIRLECEKNAESVGSIQSGDDADLKNLIYEVSQEDIESKNVSSLNSRHVENTTDDELNTGVENGEPDLLLISSEKDVVLAPCSETVCPETKESTPDLGELLPQHSESREGEKRHSWKVGYLQVKLPHKTRSKGNLKAWKKRCVSIQPDEFVNDPKNPSLMISVYSAESGSARKHGASFWKSITCQKAVVYRSSSRTHKYAFSISDDNKVVIHLAGDCEATSQDWMAAIRTILWPPSPVVQLEKMLYGKEFEISIIDNDFSFRAGLLGMYGYLTITRKKLILVHPQQGFVIQEWYLNTIDKFELVHQSKIEDVHKVLSMTTCSDSSTGKGEILMFCTESIAMLQAIASTIHQILTEHTKQDGGKYEKELAEMADWLVPAENTTGKTTSEDYYKVPPRQVKSLLDIPNFIFNKPLAPVETVSCSADDNTEKIKCIEMIKNNPTRASQDSGISTGNASEDFLNCSTTSFIVGGGNIPGKSSESELSDSYTPPRTPEMKCKEEVNRKAHNEAFLKA